MNITSSYGYGDYGYGDYGYYGYGYGDYGYGYGYGGSSIIDNSTNMFPSIHPSIIISTPPTRVILSIMTNSPTYNENITILEENYTPSKAMSKLTFGLILGISLLAGITTSFTCHKFKTYFKTYSQNTEEEPIIATDITIMKEDEL